MPSKQPTKPVKVSEKPALDGLEKKRREFQDQASNKKKPTTYKPKNKKNFLVGIIMMALLLVGLGGVAVYGFLYNNPDRVITSAIVNALTAKTTSFTGTFDIGGSYTLSLNGGLAGAQGGKLTAKLTTNKNNKTSSFGTDAVLDKDGNVYLSGEGIKGVLGNRFINDAETEGSYANILQQKVEGKWLKINSDELAPYSKKYAAIQSCIETVFKKIQDDKPLLHESADIYSKNKFLIVDKNLGNKDDSTGYSVHVESEKLKTFLNKFKETALYKQFYDCDSATFNLDVEKRVKQLTKSSSKPTKLELWINGNDEITQIVSQANIETITGTLSLKPEFNQDVKVVIPSAVVTLEEIHTHLIDGTKAMELRSQTDPESQRQYNAIIDKLRNAP